MLLVPLDQGTQGNKGRKGISLGNNSVRRLSFGPLTNCLYLAPSTNFKVVIISAIAACLKTRKLKDEQNLLTLKPNKRSAMPGKKNLVSDALAKIRKSGHLPCNKISVIFQSAVLLEEMRYFYYN